MMTSPSSDLGPMAATPRADGRGFRTTVVAVVVVALAALAAACGGGLADGPFSPVFPDNRAADIEAVLARVRASTPAPAPSLAVGVTREGALFVFDLEAGSLRWQEAIGARSIPYIAGSLVFTIEHEGQLVGRSLADGSVEVSEDAESLNLVGAGGEDDIGAVVLSTGGGVGARSRLLVTRGDSVALDLEFEHVAGAPTVRAGMVFLPWGNQNLSVLDARGGDEIARIRVADEVVGTARVEDGEVYFGQDVVMRLTPSAAGGRYAAMAHFKAEHAALPGRPPFMRDTSQPPPGANNAAHSVRLAWHPAGAGERVGLSDDNLYLIFYKLVIALDPRGGAIRWVYSHDGGDVIGATARPGGIWLADREGKVIFVAGSDGRPTAGPSMGLAPTYVSLAPPASPPSGPADGPARPLLDQLRRAAQHTDDRLAPARVLIVEHVGRMDSPEATQLLIDLCDDHGMPTAVRHASCETLAQRSVGPDQVVAALQRHAAFLDATSAPPVGALARAAANMGERRAVPLLVEHLADPETPAAELAPLVRSLAALGDPQAAGPLLAFVRLYHAERVDEPLGQALEAACEGLVALQGADATVGLAEIIDDPLGYPGLRDVATRLVAELERTAASAEQPANGDAAEHGEDDGGAQPAESPGAEAPATPELPERITTALLDEARGPVRQPARARPRRHARALPRAGSLAPRHGSRGAGIGRGRRHRGDQRHAGTPRPVLGARHPIRDPAGQPPGHAATARLRRASLSARPARRRARPARGQGWFAPRARRR